MKVKEVCQNCMLMDGMNLGGIRNEKTHVLRGV